MKLATLALALVSCAAAAAPAQAHGGDRRGAYVIVSEAWPGAYYGTRSHRTALEDGYFGEGRLGHGGRFEYDRGYPYDYYPAYEDEAYEEEDHGYAEADEPYSSGRGCESKWVRDGRSGKAEVRICRR